MRGRYLPALERTPARAASAPKNPGSPLPLWAGAASGNFPQVAAGIYSTDNSRRASSVESWGTMSVRGLAAWIGNLCQSVVVGHQKETVCPENQQHTSDGDAIAEPQRRHGEVHSLENGGDNGNDVGRNSTQSGIVDGGKTGLVSDSMRAWPVIDGMASSDSFWSLHEVLTHVLKLERSAVRCDRGRHRRSRSTTACAPKHPY